MSSEGFNQSGAELGSSGVAVRNNYNEIFQVELQCWCYGFAKFPGDLSPELVFRVIKEMAPVFKGAVEHSYIFNLMETAGCIAKATRHTVSEKEAAFCILLQLPRAWNLDEEAQYVLAQILEQSEKTYGDVVCHLEQHWHEEKKNKQDAA